MVFHAERVQHVVTLRSCAKECGVQVVREQASREKVAAMMVAIRTSDGHQHAVAKAERV